jgi:FixJ family two-component response regulator
LGSNFALFWSTGRTREGRARLCPGYPVILVSGDGDLDVFKEFEEARILQKPYREEDLLTQIAAALK